LNLARERIQQTAPEAAASLEELVREAGSVGNELRRIAHGISPSLLATRGLVDALRNECMHSGIAVTIAGEIGLSSPEVETAMFLCCLESIQNAAKHAGRDASVTVKLHRDGQRAGLQLSRHGAWLRPEGHRARGGPDEHPGPHRQRRRARRDCLGARSRHDRGRDKKININILQPT
jgi:signal transduction histidine kinase